MEFTLKGPLYHYLLGVAIGIVLVLSVADRAKPA